MRFALSVLCVIVTLVTLALSVLFNTLVSLALSVLCLIVTLVTLALSLLCVIITLVTCQARESILLRALGVHIRFRNSLVWVNLN